MKKVKTYSLFLFLSIITLCKSMAQGFNIAVDFEGEWEGGTSILKEDTSFLVIGNGRDLNAGNTRGIKLLRYNFNGVLLNKVTFRDSTKDLYTGKRDPVNNINNNFYLSASFASVPSNDGGGMLVKIHQNLDTFEIVKEFHKNNSIILDGNEIIDKKIYSFGRTAHSQGQTQIAILKTDTLGNELMYKELGGNGRQAAQYVDVYHNEFLIGSFSDTILNTRLTYFEDHINGWLLKIDTLGNILWEKQYVDSVSREAFAQAYFTQNGNVIANVNTKNRALHDELYVTEPNGWRTWLIELLDNDGNLLKQHWFYKSTNFRLEYIQEVNDGGFVACGLLKNHLRNYDREGWIVKYDENLNPLCERKYNYNG